MKKLTFILSALFVLLVASCTNELENTMQEGKLSFSSINASMADLPTSRAHLEGGGKVVWDVDDQIGIYSDTQTTPTKFTCTNVSESSATFSSDDEVSGSNFFAYYPYENTAIVDGKLDYYLSSLTEYKDGSFHRQCPIIAKSSSNNFSFKQTCGFLSFSLVGSQTIEKLTLRGNCDEYISGGGYIDIKSDIPLFTISDIYGLSKVEMSVNKELSKNEATVFYFIVPVSKFTHGITLTITGKTKDGESFNLNKTTSKCVEVSRGVIKSFSVLETDELIEDYQNTVRSKLMAFYSATGGDNWTNNDNWGTDKPYKEWYGITADDIFITGIDLSGNNLTGTISGELNGLDYLQEFYVNSNSLSAIKINSCPNLKNVLCDNNQLTTLDVSENKNLGGLHCINNILENLNVTSCNSLWSLYCDNNQLTTLDLSSQVNLLYLSLDNNRITSLDISPCKKLQSLSCMNNQITSLNISKMEQLGIVWCDHCKLKELIVTDCAQLTQLLCGYNELTTLKITNCPNINVLMCQQNKLATLDVTLFTKLKKLWCGNYESFEGNSLTTLDVSKNTLLEEFSCYGMKLNSLDVSKNTKLRLFECSGNPIQSLNVDNLTGLKELWCHTMNLYETIDVSNNLSLTFLSCFGNSNLSKIYIKSSEQVFDYVKDETTKFCIKGNDELYDEFPYYTSTDYTKDKNVTTLQTASIGNGINIVLMGDGFTDRLIDDKTYENTMKDAMEKFFAVEPYTSFRNYFNVYAVTAVSKNDIYANSSSTVFSCSVGGGGNDDKVFEYAKVAISEDKIEDAVIIVLLNEPLDENTYSGLCKLYPPTQANDYGKGANISYICLGSVENTFEAVLQHEAGGHGFAKLGDEYAGWSDMTNIPNDKITEIQTLSTYGWLKNIDLVNNPSTIKWSKFLSDERYNGEDLGIFEGGYEYKYGVYRPSFDSKMRDMFRGFNAPSREAIYYRIHKLAYGDSWQYNYEDFVEYDAINRTSLMISRSANIDKPMIRQHHAPIIIKGSWKDAIK